MNDYKGNLYEGQESLKLGKDDLIDPQSICGLNIGVCIANTGSCGIFVGACRVNDASCWIDSSVN